MSLEHELGMPLNGEDGAIARHGNRFDEAVGGEGDRNQVGRELTNCLMMERIHP